MESTTETKQINPKPPTSLQADYELLSDFFIYPQDKFYKNKIEKVFQHVKAAVPDSAQVLQPFMDFLSASTFQEMQELFLRSFDVQAITTLDIGFILFGEDYKRGQLLVHLNKEHRDAGNDCFAELSDHLPNVLRLLPRMKDEAMRNEIALRLVIPAMEKMSEEFDAKKMEKKDSVYKKNMKTLIDFSPKYRTVFQSVLQAVLMALRNDFGYLPPAPPADAVADELKAASMACGSCSSRGPVTDDFSHNIESEMNIEKF